MKHISFTNAKNGLILSITFGDEDSVETVVHEYADTEEGAVERFADFLRYLNDEYGPTTSRYSANRIYITTAPGDKNPAYSSECTCNSPGCPWCL